MAFDYINEAFKALETLDEAVFDTSLNGVKNLSDFMSNNDTVDVVPVIDANAKTDDDLQDSYIGKVIVNCNVCHSHVFEDKENIDIDSEGVVNPETTCPFCGEQSGFVIVGEIAPYNDAESTKESSEEDVEEEPVEENSVENTQGMNESFDVSLGRGKSKTSFDSLEDAITYINDGVKGYKEETYVLYDDGGKEMIWIDRYRDENGETQYTVARQEDKSLSFDKDKGISIVEKELENDKDLHDMVVLHVGNKMKEYRIAKKLADFRFVADKSEPSHVDLKNKVVYYNEGEQLDAACANIVNALKDSVNESLAPSCSRATKVARALKESFKEVSITTEDQHMEMFSDDNGKVTVTTEPIKNESVEDNTEEETINIEAADSEADESISPVSDETAEEILTNNDLIPAEETSEEPAETTEETSEEETAEEPAEEETAEPTDEESVDIEEIDEESLDELGESYLKKVYENVKSFKTSNVYTNDKNLVVEGLLTFNSGVKKSTGFIFEGVAINSRGQVKFCGSNKHLTEDANAFTLIGKLDNKKLFAESWKYNYLVNNEPVRGIVRRK